MQSSRSFKRGNKSSSSGRETKDKTKRIKCFGCEHISFHFLLLVTNNSPIFGGGNIQRDIYAKNIAQVLAGDQGSQRQHLAQSLSTLQTSFLLRCCLGKSSCHEEPAQSQAGESGEGNFTPHSSPNAAGPSQRHIMFAGAEDENLSPSH